MVSNVPQPAGRLNGVEVIEGPVNRTGARGTIRSICCRDPGGNLIDVANEISERKC
jgi:hypothetical protein